MTEQELRQHLPGKDVAEIAIEAWRDASENGFDSKLNPYSTSTYAYTEYQNACYQNGKKEQQCN